MVWLMGGGSVCECCIVSVPGGVSSGLFQKRVSINLFPAPLGPQKHPTATLGFSFRFWKQVARSSEDEAVFEDYQSLHETIGAALRILDETYETKQIQTLLCRKSERFDLMASRPYYRADFSLVSCSGNSVFCLSEGRSYSKPLVDREQWLGELVFEASHVAEMECYDHSSRGGAGASVLCAPRVRARFSSGCRAGFMPIDNSGGKARFHR